MFKLLTPQFFAKIEKPLLPILAILFPSTLCAGLYFALFSSPADCRERKKKRSERCKCGSRGKKVGDRRRRE